MPRRPRIHLPGLPIHLVQRGHNREACFFSDEDFLAYREWLGEALKKSGCALHAYVLMTNHVHLLLTPPSSQAVSQLVMSLEQLKGSGSFASGANRVVETFVDTLKRIAYTISVSTFVSTEVLMALQLVKKWGNSPAVRLPAAVMEAAQLSLEQAVEVRAENGRIVIEPAAPTYNLDELLAGITANNLHDEQDFGLSQGKELL